MRKRKKSSVIKEIEQAATSTSHSEDAAVEEYEKGAQQSPRR